MPDTKPWRRVYVDGYWMDKTEVTNEQFAKYCARYVAGGRGKGEPDTGTSHLGFRSVANRK